MPNVNLTAANETESVLLAYLEANASETLIDKINSGKKTLTDCVKFITAEARKQAKKGVAMIADNVVFGWAVHFFEEDAITAPTFPINAAVNAAPAKEGHKSAPNPAVKATPKPTPKPAKVAKPDIWEEAGQINLFDFLGGAT